MKDIRGLKFNRLTAIECVGTNKNREKMWKCKCDCGNTSFVRFSALSHGLTKSCGCLQRENAKKANTKHGLSNTRIYKIWEDMKNRCYQKSYHAYKHYGGRGISICEEWAESFQTFYDWAKTHGYKDDLSIDRIDVNGNYSPNNCRWATQKTQIQNRRTKKEIYYEQDSESGIHYNQ